MNTKQEFFAKWTLLFLVFCAFTPLEAGAFSNQEHIAFQRLSHNEGLSQAVVTTILQDRHGLMWFGTQEGLNCYDGRTFRVFLYDSMDFSSLSNSSIEVLYEDSNSVLWVGTRNGLNRYNRLDGTFTRIEGSGQAADLGQISALLEDSRGNLWVGDFAEGLFRYDREKNIFTRMEHQAGSHEDLAKCDQQYNIRALTEDSRGRLWIATNGDGLLCFDPEKNTWQHYRTDNPPPFSMPSDSFFSLRIIGEHRILVGSTGQGLLLLDEKQGVIDRFEEVSRNLDTIRAIFVDSRGTLWVSGDMGLMARPEGSTTFAYYQTNPVDPKSLSDDMVRSIYEDRGGVLWLGTQSGLSKFNLHIGLFESLTGAGISHPSVNAFEPDGQGNLWVGTHEGLSLMNMNTKQASIYGAGTPLDGLKINDLFSPSPDLLWIGSDQGLKLLNTKTGTSDDFPMETRGEHEVTVLLADREGRLWAGSNGADLFRLNPRKRVLEASGARAESEHGLSIFDMVEDGDGVLWLATDAGIGRYTAPDEKLQRFELPNSSSSRGDRIVWSLFLDSAANLWVGSHISGLFKWTAEKRLALEPEMSSFTRGRELAGSLIFDIREDNEGSIWLSSERGLSRLRNGAFTHYDSSRGLPDYSFNRGAGFIDGTGRVYFGSQYGITHFVPETIKQNKYKAPVRLTEVLVNTRAMENKIPIIESKDLEFKYEDRMISFEFAALDYTYPNRNRYRYRLDGFDSQWNKLGHDNRATYTNLPEGDYTLIVQGSNNDGVWNEEGLHLNLEVHPPPWKTWWANTLYALAAAFSLFFYYRSHARKLEQEAEYNRNLEQEVQKRTRELAQRHDELEALHDRLEEASLMDQLTGLPNRHYMLRFIQEHFGNKHEKWLLMVFDLDGFRSLNDKYGHISGDLVLVQVKQILQKVIGEQDVLLRWDSDEFLLLVKNPDIKTSRDVANRLCAVIREHSFAIGGGEHTRLTCSVGFAFYPFTISQPDLLNWQQVLMIADMALFVAKRANGDSWVGIHGHEGAEQEDLYERFKDDPQGLVEDEIIDVISSSSRKLLLNWQ